MAMEAISDNSSITPNLVDRRDATKHPVAQTGAVSKSKSVPLTPKVEIDRQPVISSGELEAKIAELNEAMVARNQAIVFSKDPATGKDVVRVTNKSTGELIRQMPSVEALKAMQNIDQMMGLIFNQRT